MIRTEISKISHRRAAAGWDPACTMPSMKDYFEQLRIKDASDLEAERSTSFPPSAESVIRKVTMHYVRV